PFGRRKPTNMRGPDTRRTLVHALSSSEIDRPPMKACDGWQGRIHRPGVIFLGLWLLSTATPYGARPWPPPSGLASAASNHVRRGISPRVSQGGAWAPTAEINQSCSTRSADKHRLRCLGFFECRHNLFREPIELLQGNLLWHADREAYRDAVERRVFLLERLEVLDQVIRITAQEAAGLDRFLDARQLGGRRTLGITHDLYLLFGDRTHQTQLSKHLHVFFVILRPFLHPLLAAVGHVKLYTEASSLTELDRFSERGMRRLPVESALTHRPTRGRATAYHALDTVLGHELERAHRAALDRLPALDRQLERSRDEGEFFEGVAAIRHLGRQRVVLPYTRSARC